MARIDPNKLALEERVVQINRVAKVVKGGRRFSFSAVVVVGDGQGHVGAGLGKAGEVPEAIRKGVEDAKKHIIKIPMVGTTIPHEVNVEFAASKVMLKPASQGTGVIAGGSVRAVLEAAGIRDILSKIYGSTNPVNVTRATIEALRGLHSAEELSARRGRQAREPHLGSAGTDAWRRQMPGKLRVTQTRSTISHIARNRATIKALGLHGIGSTSIVPDNDATRGMVRQVRFLVSVEEVAEESSRGRGRDRERCRSERRRGGPGAAMKLHDLRPAEGSRTERTRVGRGIAAGKGKTAGRGTKGQKARAGGSIPPWFEGGQTPLHVRIPKLRGFRNRGKVVYEIVNVGDIDAAVERGALETQGAEVKGKSKGSAQITVNQDILRAVGLVRSLDKPLKILGAGELNAPCSSWPTRSPARREPRSRPPEAACPSSKCRPARRRRSVSTPDPAAPKATTATGPAERRGRREYGRRPRADVRRRGARGRGRAAGRQRRARRPPARKDRDRDRGAAEAPRRRRCRPADATPKPSRLRRQRPPRRQTTPRRRPATTPSRSCSNPC